MKGPTIVLLSLCNVCTTITIANRSKYNLNVLSVDSKHHLHHNSYLPDCLLAAIVHEDLLVTVCMKYLECMVDVKETLK